VIAWIELEGVEERNKDHNPCGALQCPRRSYGAGLKRVDEQQQIIISNG
jgi:hypothetical protein